MAVRQAHTCCGARVTVRRLVGVSFSYIMWAPGVRFTSSELAADTFTCRRHPGRPSFSLLFQHVVGDLGFVFVFILSKGACPHVSQHPFKQAFPVNQMNTTKNCHAFQSAVCDHDVSFEQDVDLYSNGILKQFFAVIQIYR